MKPGTTCYGRCYVELGLTDEETNWTILNLKLDSSPDTGRSSLRIWMSGLFHYTSSHYLDLFLIDRENRGLNFPRFIVVDHPVVIHNCEDQLAIGVYSDLVLCTGCYELHRLGNHGAVTVTIQEKLAIAS